jgi:hypothetical protein
MCHTPLHELPHVEHFGGAMGACSAGEGLEARDSFSVLLGLLLGVCACLCMRERETCLCVKNACGEKEDNHL